MSKFTELSLEYYSCHHNLVSVAIWNLEPLAHARSPAQRPAPGGDRRGRRPSSADTPPTLARGPLCVRSSGDNTDIQ